MFSNATFIGENDELLVENTLFDVSGLNDKSLNWFDNGLAAEMFLYSSRVSGFTMAIRKSFVSKISIKADNHELKCGAIHDEMITLCAIAYNTLGYIREPLADYRQHYFNASGTHDWIYRTFVNPNPYRSFAVRLERYGELPKPLKDKANFINLRLSFKYNNGIIRIFINLPAYRKIYGRKWYKFMFVDIMDWCTHFLERIAHWVKKPMLNQI